MIRTLIGKANRRTALAGIAAAVVLTVVVTACSGGDPTATPTETPSPQEIEADAVLVAYTEANAEALEHGRAAARLITAGDARGFHQRLAPSLQAQLPAAVINQALDELTTNVVRFDVAPFGTAFAGQLSGDEISGSVWNGNQGEFRMRRIQDGGRAGAESVAGRWEGLLRFEGVELGIEAELQETDAGLTGSMTFPDADMERRDLSRVRYDNALEIGDRIADIAFRGRYVAEHAWGEGSLVMIFRMTADGSIEELAVTPVVPLPPDPRSDYLPKTKLRLPFSGQWLAIEADPDSELNHHAGSSGQRHAADLVEWKNGANYHGDGSANEQYWIWGQPVLAPADGTVVAVRDGLPENIPGQTTDSTDPQVAPGNHVVLDLGNDEFLYLAHLQNGSVRAQVGERVVAGQTLGLVGNSGNSFEPHLHIHVQDRSEFLEEAIGLPLVFSNYEAGGDLVSEGRLVEGQLIRSVR